jgi:hypothetical protein
MALGLGDVRYWMNSGKHTLALSFSGFDPSQTSDPPYFLLADCGRLPVSKRMALARAEDWFIASDRLSCPPEVARTAMIVNGLYSTTLKMELKMLDSTERVSGGVMVLHNGRMFGGGPFFYTVGHYTCSGNKWKGEMTSREHTPASAMRLWAGKVVTLGFTGTFTDEVAETDGIALVGKRSIPFRLIYRLLKSD